MKKLIFLYLISDVVCCVQSVRLFDPVWLSYEKRLDGSRSNVLSLSNDDQFAAHVVNSSKPTVVSIVLGNDRKTQFFRRDFQQVSDALSDDVAFYSMEYTKNHNIIQSILLGLYKRGLLKTTSIALPLLLLFKEKGVLVQLYAGGPLTEKTLTRMIRQGLLNGQGLPGDGSKEQKPGFFEKLKRWFVGMQDVTKEIGAYQYARRWKQRKRLGI